MTDERSPVWFWALLPLALLGALSVALTRGSLLEFLRRGVPPVEQLTFERTILSPGAIRVDVVNGGPSPVTVAQVTVDKAFWDFTISPFAEIPRLGRATIEIPYPWVRGEPHRLTHQRGNLVLLIVRCLETWLERCRP